MNVKILTVTAATAVFGLVAFFASNIYGYYRFIELCKEKGGGEILTKLEKGNAWQATEGIAAMAGQYHATFVRFRKKDGVTYDAVFEVKSGGARQPRYTAGVADQSKPVRYELRERRYQLPGEIRLGRTDFEVVDLRNGEVAVRYRYFDYELFDRDSTLLSAPSGSVCPTQALWGPQDPRTGQASRGELMRTILKAFE